MKLIESVIGEHDFEDSHHMYCCTSLSRQTQNFASGQTDKLSWVSKKVKSLRSSLKSNRRKGGKEDSKNDEHPLLLQGGRHLGISLLPLTSIEPSPPGSPSKGGSKSARGASKTPEIDISINAPLSARVPKSPSKTISGKKKAHKNKHKESDSESEKPSIEEEKKKTNSTGKSPRYDDIVKTFKIKIIQGENLLVDLPNNAGKENGNPFVRIKAKTIKEIKIKTTKAKRKQMNPIWETEFAFSDLTFPVHCACYSTHRRRKTENKIKEELIGQFLIERSHVQVIDQLVQRWYILETLQPSEAPGKILVEMIIS